MIADSAMYPGSSRRGAMREELYEASSLRINIMWLLATYRKMVERKSTVAHLSNCDFN